MPECPYKKECATVLYWPNWKKEFILEVCNTDLYVECLYYFGSLKPQHDERERLHGDPHYGEPNWDAPKAEAPCFLCGRDRILRKQGEVFVCEECLSNVEHNLREHIQLRKEGGISGSNRYDRSA